MNSKLTPVSEIRKFGHGQRVPEIIVRVINACRPYTQTERDKEYKWHRQLVNLEGGDGERISMMIYSSDMHLASSTEGQVWRFRCLPSDAGPRGIEMKKWSPAGSQEVRIELKMTNQADASRLPFLENEEPAKQEEPKAKPETSKVMSNPQNKKPNPDEVEELVAADIFRRRDVGREKYGRTMERDDIDILGWLIHRYEEVLDDANYTRRLIRDLDQGRLVLVPAEELASLREIAAQHTGIPAFSTKTEPVEKMSEAPVEKPMRNSKAPKGSDPLREERKPDDEPPWSEAPREPEKKEEPRRHSDPRENRPTTTPSALDEEFKRNNLKHIARFVRDAYNDEATDEEVERAHGCLKLMKDNKYRWTEVFDVLTAKTKAESPGLIGKAFARIKDQINSSRDENDPRSDEQICEAICKKPSALREAIEWVQSQS